MPIFIILDYLDIPLLHGWVLDPQDKITADVIQNQSYNQIINILVEYRSLLDRTIGSYKSSKLSKKEKNETEMKGDGSKMKGDVSVLVAEEPVISGEEFSAVSEESPGEFEKSETEIKVDSGIKSDLSVPATEEPIINGEVISAVSEESPGEYDSKDMENLKIQADNDEIESVNSGTKDLADSSSYVIINSSSDRMEADNHSEIQTHYTTEKGMLESEMIPNSTELNEVMNNIPPVPSEKNISEKYNSEELKNDLSEEDLKLFRDGEIIEAFLALTASQLTYLGQ
jgi:hypothetical protein